MKIAIDLTSLYGRKITGLEVYGIDMYKALLKSGHVIIPIFHVKNTIDNNSNAYIIHKRNRLWLENVSLSSAVRKIKPDIVLFPIFPPPIDIYFGTKAKILPTLHDFAFLNFRKTLNIAAKYYLTPKFLFMFKHADAIITISNTIKEALKLHSKKPVYNCGNIISSDYCNCQDSISDEYLKQFGLETGKYVITVSTVEPRKNNKYLLKVLKPMLERKNMKLLLVGRKGWGNDKALKVLIESYGERIIFTGFVEFNVLVSLYHYAYAFSLLSLDECFGRTPYEAVACGCRKVILSDIPIFHETFGEDAMFLPLNNEAECVERLKCQIPDVPEDFEIPYDVLEKNLLKLLNDLK